MNKTTTELGAAVIGRMGGLNVLNAAGNQDRFDEAMLLLLARAYETDEAAETAYVLIRITPDGISELEYLAQNVKQIIAASERFCSLSFYLPAGVDVYPITDDDEVTLARMINEDDLRDAMLRLADGTEIVLTKTGYTPELPGFGKVVRLAPVGEEICSRLADELEPDFTVYVHLVKFGGGDRFNITLPFKNVSGEYWFDSMSVERLQKMIKETDTGLVS